MKIARIRSIKVSILLMVLFAGVLQAREKVVVFHAGSLAVPFAAMEKAFEAACPQYDLVREAGGSRSCARKITEVKRPADVMASADYAVIDNLLIPDYAKFNAHFAVNRMVLAYTEKARYGDEINSTNWPDILLRPGVKSGHSNPNLDPCGYRAVLTVKLAGLFYGKPDLYDKLLGYGDSYTNGEENRKRTVVRPKETDLLALLEVGAMDYLFIYRSVASQHKLKFIELPPQVNLGDAAFKETYHKVSFKISGKQPGAYIEKRGAPMVYGITMLQQAERLPLNRAGALAFIKFVLSEKGQSIMRQNGQPPIVPPRISGESQEIRKMLEE